MGKSDFARTAKKACSSSFRSLNVSRMKPLTPPSIKPTIWRVKSSWASFSAVGPKGSIRTPSGPVAPSTCALLPAALPAICAAVLLMSSVFSASP